MNEFNRNFRLKVLALLLDNLWMSKYGNTIIDSSFFERDDEEMTCKAVLEYRDEYRRSPTDPEDVIFLAGEEHTEFIMRVYDVYEGEDLSLASDMIIKWARQQAAKLAILESVDEIDVGNYENIIGRMEDVLSIGDSIRFPGIDPVADVDKWLYDYWTHKVGTGWNHVDGILEGGLGPGELGIILAPQNRGKSMSLINIGYGAATIGRGKNVAHWTHEMSIPQVAKRYAARTIFRFPNKHEDLDKYADDFIEAAQKMLPGKIRIMGGRKMTIREIRNDVDRLIAEGFEPDLIIDDYPDLIIPERTYSQRRFELSAIYEDFRELGREYNVPVWGASQSGRSSHSKELITLADIAEDIGKTSIADVVISVCQTREEEEVERARLFMAKVRDGEKHATFTAKYYGKQQAIITTGIARKKEKRERD